jgi:hypothetical protein
LFLKAAIVFPPELSVLFGGRSLPSTTGMIIRELCRNIKRILR